MGRPRAVNIKTFHEYDKLHTERVKMNCGVEMTALYPIKETDQYWMSHEVWASCASKFKRKKKYLPELRVDIQILTDEKTATFLEEHAWHDWVPKHGDDSDTKETIAMLARLFPDKTPVYFYELDSLLNSYCWGTFKPDGNLKNRKYYTHKYNRLIHVRGEDTTPEIRAAYDAYRVASDKRKENKGAEEEARLFGIYHDLESDYAYEHFCLDDVFSCIGDHAVCYPVAFTRGTADWHKEKHGKTCAYAHAGEIFFVATKDKVYFETKRHY